MLIMGCTTKREMCSLAAQCAVGCRYCFAEFNDYQRVPTSPFESILGPVIVYPFCDGEFGEGAIDNLCQRLRGIEAVDGLVVSISTKTEISDATMRALGRLDKELRDRHQGFAKCAVSFSCWSDWREQEPYASSPSARLTTLEKVAASGIATSVTLKPLLPFVSDDEYFGLIDSATRVSNHFLLGGLYVDLNSSFYREFGCRMPPPISRAVDWMPGTRMWPYIEDPRQMSALRHRIQDNGAHVHETDTDVVRALQPGSSFGGNR